MLHDGEMGERIRAFEWSATPLGPMSAWPQSLRTATNMILASGLPMMVVWGAEHIQIYNDAMRLLAASRHPGILGRSVNTGVPGHWPIADVAFARALAGESLTRADMPLMVDRAHGPDEAWFTGTFSPVKADDGSPGGVIVMAYETTERVLAEQQLRESRQRQGFLLRLSDALRTVADPVRLQAAGAKLVGEQLGMDRAAYAELSPDDESAVVVRDWTGNGLPSIVGTYRSGHGWPSLTEAIRSGNVATIDDTAGASGVSRPERGSGAGDINAGDIRAVDTNIRAEIAYPIVRQGRLKAAFIGHSQRPRRWSPGDISLVMEASECIWGAVERARAELALRDSEMRYKGFLRASNQAVYRHDPTWSELRHMSGGNFLKATENPDPDWFNRYIPAQAQPHVWAAIQEAIRGNSFFELEHQVYRADGTLGWTLSRSAPVVDATGEVIEWFGAASDVTAHHQAEMSLRASEARFRQFADASSDVLWIRDADTLKFEFVSAAFQAVYGDVLENVLHGNTLRPWAKLILPEDRKSVLRNFRRVRNGERVTHEFRIRRPRDGAIRWIRNTDFPLLDEQGRARRIGGIGHDVTAEKEAELRLREVNTGLERHVEERTNELMATEATLRQVQKIEAVGQLASGIAHDFNNMLQGIGGSLELTRRRSEQGRLAEAVRNIDNAMETVRRAAALTHRLLAFSRQQRLAPQSVNLDELVGGMAEMIQRTVGSAIQVDARLGGVRWSVLCDASQLENALLNLCVNARDAMPDGGWLTILTSEVELSDADVAGEPDVKAGSYVGVSVTDTGIGMAPDVVARAFEPFYTLKPLGQGTGLGLSQVYGFVRQSGGLVRIESAPGQGTIIRLILPRHVALDEARDADASAEVVLLIEDEESSRALAAEWLQDAGYRVLEAAEGTAALRLLHSGGRVDILVTDVGLPGMNGRQVAEAARVERPDLPVLFITGYAGTALHAALPRGMTILEKPFALETLTARVRSMLAEP